MFGRLSECRAEFDPPLAVLAFLFLSAARQVLPDMSLVCTAQRVQSAFDCLGVVMRHGKNLGSRDREGNSTGPIQPNPRNTSDETWRG